MQEVKSLGRIGPAYRPLAVIISSFRAKYASTSEDTNAVPSFSTKSTLVLYRSIDENW